MPDRRRLLDRSLTFIDRHFLWLLLGSYLLAALVPAPGERLQRRDPWSAEPARPDDQGLPLDGPARGSAPRRGPGRPGPRVEGPREEPVDAPRGLGGKPLRADRVHPRRRGVMVGWHNPDEVQNILVGLALVASMPIAGSSTAWAQNADGDLALSLGLVLGSTLLSPLTTPLALHAVGLMATGRLRRGPARPGGRTARGRSWPSASSSRRCSGSSCALAGRAPVAAATVAEADQLGHPARPLLLERRRLAAPGDRPARPGLPRRDPRDRGGPLRPHVRRGLGHRPVCSGRRRGADRR